MGTLRSLFDLTGRVALITGGSSGLGLQAAQALGEYGATVVIAARKQAQLDEAAAGMIASGIKVVTVPADLRDATAAQTLCDTVMAQCGRIDILFNNAGATWGAPAEKHTPDNWRRVLGLNVDAMFYLSQCVARAWMIPQKKGKIINISSVAGFKASISGPGTVAYQTSKTAVIGLTRSLGAEWGKYGINVNAIAPGWFPSKMTAHVDDAGVAEMTKRIPMHKIGSIDDLKGLALLLASDAGGHITGQTIVIDGGSAIV